MDTLGFTKIRKVSTPTRGHVNDAGIDFFIPVFDEEFVSYIETMNSSNAWREGSVQIDCGERVLIPSGIKLDIPAGTALMGFNKSGVGLKKGLHLISQVIDSGYQGELIFNFANFTNEIIQISEGEKIIQYVLMPIYTPTLKEFSSDLELYSSFSSTRGGGGFGSTGT